MLLCGSAAGFGNALPQFRRIIKFPLEIFSDSINNSDAGQHGIRFSLPADRIISPGRVILNDAGLI